MICEGCSSNRLPRLLPSLACMALLVIVAACPMPQAHATERSEVDAKYKWDITDLYATEADWEAARERLAGKVTAINTYKGRLGESPAVLLEALNSWMGQIQELSRLSSYASMTFDVDTRVSKSQEMQQGASKIGTDFSSASSYIRPELIALGADKVNAMVAAEPKLNEYRVLLDNMLRYAPHTLSGPEERIAAMAGDMAGTGEEIYSILTDADFPYPTITLSTGESVRLDGAAYSRWRQAPNRADRKLVFQEFWKAHDNFKRTIGTSLYSGVKAHVFNKDIRKFDSCLQAALFSDNVPVTVYKRLLADVNENLPTLHRYLALRQRMMGLKDLGYEDLYAPMVAEVDMAFTPESAQEVTIEATRVLGTEYVDVLKEAFSGGWMDWMPTTGKRSGAYSTGVYGVHPYQLQNFNGTYDDVGTLAHEAGHSMHTYLSMKNQPFVTHDYATFVAEVASTANENFLLHTMLIRTQDEATRLFLLGSYLENMRTTLFRQTMFAEFELAIHEQAEKGEPLTGENLNETYLGLVRKYYGHDKGICSVDSLYAVEWAFVNHFYYNFYVFQYATSMIASTSLAHGILEEQAMGEGKTAKRDAYLKMLSSGSSKYPVDLLREAGVDMTTSEPFKAAMREMNSVMDEMEKLLAKKRGKKG
ncbi:MAG: oligoendopeptidase F [Candidatus Eisenbacteria bacterium]|nr:oligoendopeptidase F [Candidatus Eisenbacteria bacterium]